MKIVCPECGYEAEEDAFNFDDSTNEDICPECGYTDIFELADYQP